MATHDNTYFTYSTPHGPISLLASPKGICEVSFGEAPLDGRPTATALTNEAANEIQEYLAGKRKSFEVPLDLRGSSFQKAVWTEVARIEYGRTCAAADIAAALGKPGAHRSVGTALRANRLAPFIPTHRVIIPNATGKQAKIFRALVALEQRYA